MIDTQKLKDFRADFAEAMKDLEQKYGLVISLGSIKYSPTEFEGKITCKEGESQDEVNAGEFRKYCKTYGLDPEDYDRIFEYKGKKYVIAGILPSKRKYPVLGKTFDTGEVFCFSAEFVRQLLGK